MSWSDILYPENEQKREKIRTLIAELKAAMVGNFDAVDYLVDVLNTHCATTFKKITMDRDKTVKENCEVFVAKMNEICTYLDTIDKKLKEGLDPEIYRKLGDSKTTLGDLFQYLNPIAFSIVGVAGTIAAAAVAKYLYNGLKPFINTMLDSWIALGASAFGGIIAGAILTLAVELIVAAILGAIERDKLNKELDSIQGLYDTFDVQSRLYTISINKAAARIEVYFENRTTHETS